MKTLDEFFASYGEMHDAVIRDITISYTLYSKLPTIIINSDCILIADEDNWANLKIQLFEVEEFRILELNSSNKIIFELSISRLGEKLIFNFSPNIVPSESVEEHRGSSFYAVCKSFWYEEIV